MNVCPPRVSLSKSFSALLKAILLCLFTLPVNASALQGKTIESFISSLQDVMAFIDESDPSEVPEELAGDDDWGGDISTPFSNLVEQLQAHPPTRQKVAALAEAHGFGNLDDWSKTGDRIFRAYMAAVMPSQPSMDTGAMNEYLGSLEGLPEASKAEIMTMMAGVQRSNAAIRSVPAEDMSAIQPYLDELMALYEMDADSMESEEYGDGGY